MIININLFHKKMKKLLFITLIYFAATATTVDEEKLGPAYNYKNEGAEYSCEDRYVFDEDGNFRDDSSSGFVPAGVSDCVDLLLWSTNKNRYFDHCCYVRFQYLGNMHAGCVGLSEENYLDSTVTIKRMEDGDRSIWSSKAANSKIYQLDCISSYLKALSFTSILLLALFF